MDWHIEQLYLKVTHPLCNVLVIATTEGVEISHGSVQWDNPLYKTRYLRDLHPTIPVDMGLCCFAN